MLALCVSGSAADKAPTSLCATGVPGAPVCDVPKKDLKEAKAAFARGVKLQNAKRLDEALEEFETASHLVPQDVNFATARELARQHLVFEHLQRGNNALLGGKQVEALGEFRTAVHLDPENEFAQQRMKEALGQSAPRVATPPRVVASEELQVAPRPGQQDFHVRGDSRELLTRIAQAFGVTPIFDDSVVSRRVRFDVLGVDFYTALQAASDVTKTFWTPLGAKEILIAADTPENHRQFDRMALRTFYVPAAASPQDLNDLTNPLRTLFGITFITQHPQVSTITVRAPQRILDAATTFLEGLDAERQQVVLDVKLYEISNTLTRNLGLTIPNQFQLFNIPAGALAALGGQNIQNLINQLISGGGINQANSTSLQALLAQLQNQQNSIFSQPLATFGNGLTLFGVSLGTAAATLQLNESSIKTLNHATLRASDGKDAKLTIGSRFPILNASFAPIFNTAAISQVIGNNSFQPPFPSFSYEDLGLTVKAKPRVHRETSVSLDLELQLRSLGTTSLNGVPVINNREYKGSINLNDGEPAVVAGTISRTEQLTMQGIPGLGFVPGLNKVMTNNSKQLDEDEFLLVVTPHILTMSPESGSEIWLSTAK
jgi:general secretion pathway protein D